MRKSAFQKIWQEKNALQVGVRLPLSIAFCFRMRAPALAYHFLPKIAVSETGKFSQRVGW
jgi:hypothetical protein